MTIADQLETAHKLTAARRYAAAEDALRLVLAEAPDDVRALDLLGFVLYFQDRPAEAEAACRRALDVRPGHPYALKGLGLCLAKQGAVDDGIRYLEQAIAKDLRWFDPQWDLIVTLVEAQRFEAAEQALAQSSARLTDRAHAWEQLAKHIAAARQKAQGA